MTDTTTRGTVPATTAEIVAWLARHGLSESAGVGAVLAAVRRDLAGVCSACRPTEETA